MVDEMNFWLKRMENVTVSFLTFYQRKKMSRPFKGKLVRLTLFSGWRTGVPTDQVQGGCRRAEARVLHGGPTAGSESACRGGESLNLAQHLPPEEVSPCTWKTASWLSICLKTRLVPLPVRPTVGSASASRPGESLYLEDCELAQLLPLHQVSLSTWKTDSWLSICL
jgi:hypothetical protein